MARRDGPRPLNRAEGARAVRLRSARRGIAGGGLGGGVGGGDRVAWGAGLTAAPCDKGTG